MVKQEKTANEEDKHDGPLDRSNEAITNVWMGRTKGLY